MKTFKDHILSTEDLPMELIEEIDRIIEKEHEIAYMIRNFLSVWLLKKFEKRYIQTRDSNI